MHRRKERVSTDAKQDFADMHRRKEKISTDTKQNFVDMHRRKEKISTDTKQDSADFFRRAADQGSACSCHKYFFYGIIPTGIILGIPRRGHVRRTWYNTDRYYTAPHGIRSGATMSEGPCALIYHVVLDFSGLLFG